MHTPESRQQTQTHSHNKEQISSCAGWKWKCCLSCTNNYFGTLENWFPLVALSSETITAALNSYKVSRDSEVWNVLLFRLSFVLGSLDNEYPTWHICPQKETGPGWDRKRQITEICYTEADVSDLILVPLVLTWHLWFVRRGAIGKKWGKTRWQTVYFLS